MAAKQNRYINLGFAGTVIAVAAVCVGNILSNLNISDANIGVAEGTFPIIIAGLLLAFGCLVVIEELMKKRKVDEENIFIKAETEYALKVAGLLIICVLLFPMIGFVGAMGLYTFVFMTFITPERKGLKYRIVCAVLIPVLVFLLFRVLYITLPEPFWLV